LTAVLHTGKQRISVCDWLNRYNVSWLFWLNNSFILVLFQLCGQFWYTDFRLVAVV